MRCCSVVVAIYVDSWIFVFGTAIIDYGIGVDSNLGVCSAAILLCLFCYISTKVRPLTFALGMLRTKILTRALDSEKRTLIDERDLELTFYITEQLIYTFLAEKAVRASIPTLPLLSSIRHQISPLISSSLYDAARNDDSSPSYTYSIRLEYSVRLPRIYLYLYSGLLSFNSCIWNNLYIELRLVSLRRVKKSRLLQILTTEYSIVGSPVWKTINALSVSRDKH